MNQSSERLKQEYFSVNRKKKRLIALLLALNVAAAIVSIGIGPYDISIRMVFRAVWEHFTHHETLTQIEQGIALNIRLPHVVTSMLAGAMLAGAGLIMQGIFQNPLVSPFTMGVSNGAGCGAAVAIAFFGETALFSLDYVILPLFAFGFAALTMLAVQAIGKLANDSTRSLILAGIAVGYLFTAVTSFIKYTVDSEKLPAIVFWQMGSVSSINWQQIGVMLCAALLGLTLLYERAWDMNVMTTGEETAGTLGIDYKKTRRLAFFVSTLMTGTAVAFTGTIGFVGLVAPHVARRLVGNDYRYTVPTAVLCGSLLLLTADALTRLLVHEIALPIGVVTSIIGVPFFIRIIIKRRRGSETL